MIACGNWAFVRRAESGVRPAVEERAELRSGLHGELGECRGRSPRPLGSDPGVPLVAIVLIKPAMPTFDVGEALDQFDPPQVLGHFVAKLAAKP
jgi:hypothetical protein